MKQSATTPAPSGATRYFPALTGLRAVATYLVFLHHYDPAPTGTFIHQLFAQGYIGVSIFFVLSGFLIYYRYADTYFDRQNWSWRRYLQNRFARIYPLYGLLMLLTVGVNALSERSTSWLLLGLNVTLLKGLFDTYKFSGIPQSWSLTVEVCFYLLAPFLFIALQRLGSLRLTAGLLIIGLGLWATVGQFAENGLFGSLPFVFFYTFLGRSFDFIVGMWLAQHWYQLPIVRHSTLGGLLVISICVLWQAFIPTLISDAIGLFWCEVVVYNFLLPAGIGLFLLGILREKTAFCYLLTNPFVQALGHSSYAFYLIHIGIIANGLQKVGVINHWFLFGLLVLIAHGLYLFIEKPLHRWLWAKSPVNPSTP